MREMNKKDLFTLIFIPIVIIGYSLYTLSEFEKIKTNNQDNTIATIKLDEVLSNIKATSDEEEKRILIKYLNSTKDLLIREQESEVLYIEFIEATIRDALIISTIWVVLLFVVYHDSRSRKV